MHYNLTVEITGEHLDETAADGVLTALQGLSPVIGHQGARPSIVITLEAADLRQAIARGLAVVEQATGRAVVVVEAMSTREFDERNGL